MNLRNIVVAAALALPFSAAPASAQFLTFVSAAGNGANTCFVQASPCRTLQRAINQTSAGDEVRLLTSLTGSGFINKSITIEGGQNTVIGIMVVNNASAIVRFRRLNLNGRHALATGFNLINAAAVHIEECSIERYTGDGIALGANVSTELFISDSVARDANQGLRIAQPTTATATIENSLFLNSTFRGIQIDAGEVSLAHSVIAGSGDNGMFLESGASSVSDTIAFGNGASGFVVSNGQMSLVSSTVAKSDQDGLFVTGGPIRISESLFTGTTTGIRIGGAGVLTLGDNLIAGNTADLFGTLTSLTPE